MLTFFKKLLGICVHDYILIDERVMFHNLPMEKVIWRKYKCSKCNKIKTKY